MYDSVLNGFLLKEALRFLSFSKFAFQRLIYYVLSLCAGKADRR